LVCFQASTVAYKEMVLRFPVDLSIFVVDVLFFVFLKLTGIFLDVFCKDLMVSFVHLIFQVYKWLKSRVQPQTSFLTTKKSIMELFFLFFLHFIVSSSLFIMFVFFSGFNWRLKRHASEISRSSVHFCCGYLFFWVCQPNCYFSWIFFQRSNGFFLFILFFR